MSVFVLLTGMSLENYPLCKGNSKQRRIHYHLCSSFLFWFKKNLIVEFIDAYASSKKRQNYPIYNKVFCVYQAKYGSKSINSQA